LGDGVADLLSTITGSLASTGLSVLERSDAKLTFRSNASPEITIDIPALVRSARTTEGEDSAIATDANELMMKLMAPQISLQAKNLGFRMSVAPYGKPIPNAWIIFLVVIAASGLIGAKIAWTICSRIPPK